jgi:hypothetical protein
MATAQDTVITSLDTKIEELQTTLDALRRTRAFFAAERERQGILDTHAQTNVQDERPPEIQPSDTVYFPTQPAKSIGMMVLDHLNQVGRPIHVDELMPKLRNKGSQASRQTIIGTLARYTKEGKLKRIAPNTYVVKMLRPPEPQAAHPAQESNGLKLAKQPIQPGTLKYDCYTALKERGQFMTAGEVHKVLSQRGKTFNAQNPVDHVASAMRDSIREGEKVFTRDNERRFGLEEWQIAQTPQAHLMSFEHTQNNGINVSNDSGHEL